MLLKNKLNITDLAELARAEEQISKKKAVELFVQKYVEMNVAHPFRDDDVIIRTKLEKPNKIEGLH